ncbi:MAG TPA: ABC transporter permease [Candidatus Limnocylindrales bacterium]|nr:ABC transporter permease [Candidatus Limnocylindrales bacterium]
MTFLQSAVAWFLDGAHWHGTDGVPNRLSEHLLMSGVSVLAAAIVALPIGIGLGHRGRGGFVAINVSNVGRAIPSFGLLVIALQVFGIGAKPAFVALFALAIPPMMTNSYVGITQVDPDVREAARGMGMRERAILFRVEIPLALPLIMAGLRTSAVQVVATATLAALVAWGGLGRYIVDGLAQRDFVQVFCGAVLVAVLSIIVELALAGLQRLALPRGLRLTQTTSPDVPRDLTTGLKAA